MGFWSTTKKVVGHVINVRVDHWLDWKHLKETASYFVLQFRQLFVPKTAQHPESFEEAVQRLDLSDETLVQQAEHYKRLSTVFFIMTIGLLGYAIYVALFGKWVNVILCLALAVYAIARTFQFHFWHFQISNKKLGCSVKEWYRSLLSPVGTK